MKPNSDRSTEPSRAAEDAFSDWLRLVDEGHDADFDAFCGERPQLADELRTLRDRWDEMAGVVDELGSGFDDDGPPPTHEGPAHDPDDGVGEPAAGNGNGNGRSHRHGELSATFELDVEGRSLGNPGSIGASGVSTVIQRLSSNAGSRRYSPRGEIARGGMGVVQRMWDSDLRRNLAMKVMLPRKFRRGARDSAGESRQIARFLEEAQITGQLDHPGIVPVHELGLNDAGQLYFTMRLVRGRDLRAIFELVHDEREGWTVARALGVIQRVCDAMAYAHSKRVIHRDIKPSNIMVGRFGEVYVMDWGLAKVMGRKDMHDLRPAVEGAETVSHVHTDRQDDNEQLPDSPLQTVDGTVVGTPSYMSPEQAKGQDEHIGPHSDIYSVGALLYHLLSGQMPYVEPGERVSPYTLLNAVREGPPTPIHQIDRRVPPELVAICEKAMARDATARYPTMQHMADDLRAFLEGRVVRTYETGALAEARKWVVRNKGSAAVLAMAFLALAVLVGHLFTKNEDLHQSNLAKTESEKAAREASDELAKSNAELRAQTAEAEAATRRADEAAAEARYNGYVASIAAADAGLRFHELGEATSSLGETPEHLRGWEWRHLALKTDPSLRTLEGHASPVTTVAFDPLGTLLATGDRSGKVRVWNMAQMSLLNVFDHDADTVTALAFHPNGRTLACAGPSGRITLWDAVKGGEDVGEFWQYEVDKKANDPVSSLAFSPNGKQLFAGAGRRVCSWNVDNAEHSAFLALHQRPITALDVSPDGLHVVTGSSDRTTRLWDAATGDLLHTWYEETSVLDVAFYDGKAAPCVAVGTEAGVARLYSLEDRDVVAVYEGHTGTVNTVDFSPDGSQLLTASADSTVRCWNTFSGEEIAVLSGHVDVVNGAAFSPDRLLVASGSEDRRVKIWDRAYEGASTTMRGHSDYVRSVALSPDGLRLVSAGWDSRVHLWETDTLLSMSAADLPLEGAALVAFSPDGTRVAAVRYKPDRDVREHPVYFYDASRHEELRELPYTAAGHEETVNAIAWSPDGRRVATASDDSTIKLWNAENGTLVQTLEGPPTWVRCLAFHPTENLLAAGSYDDSVRLWDLGSSEMVQEFLDRDGLVQAVAWHPDGERIVAAHDEQVVVRDRRGGAPLYEMSGHQAAVTALSFDPEGERLASASADGTLRIWDGEQGTHLLTLRAGEACHDATFSPDGGRLYAALGQRIHVFETAPPAVTYALRRPRALVAKAARKLFEDKLARYVSPGVVIDELADDDTLDPVVQAEALRLARNFCRHPERLAHTAWEIVAKDRRDEALVDEAFRLVRAAESLSPGDAWILTVMGATSYRRGDDPSALSALQESNAKRGPGDDYPLSWNLLFMAMANQRLGAPNLAREYLERARVEAMDDSQPDTRDLLLEAEKLVTGS